MDTTTVAGPSGPRAFPRPRTPWWDSPVLHLALLAVLGLAAYANSLSAPLTLDDPHYIADSPDVMSLRALLASWRTSRRLVAILSFDLQYALHGLDLRAFHTVNLAIHLLATAATYGLTALLARQGGVAARPARLTALIAAAVFLAHPLQTESVTYLVQRMTSLAGLLYLVALLAYARSGVAAGPWTRRGLLGTAFLAALLAMRTKETALTLPVAVALQEIAFGHGPRRRRAARVAFMAASTVALVSTVFPAPGGLVQTVAQVTRVQTTLGRWDYLATELPVLLAYLRLFVLPVGQSLDHRVAPRHGWDGPVVASAAILVLLAGLAVLGLRQRRRAELRVGGFGVLFFFISISLESSVFPIVDLMAEHRLYLPSVGLSMAAAPLVVGGAASLGRRARVSVGAGVTAWVLALAAATVARNQLWRDPVALWTDVVEKGPGNARAHTSLATLLLDRGDSAGARRHLEVSLSLEPLNAKTVGQLGNVDWADGQRADACRRWERCVHLDPGLAGCHYNVAGCYEMIGDRDAALREYRRFLDLAQPDDHERAAQVRRRFGW